MSPHEEAVSKPLTENNIEKGLRKPGLAQGDAIEAHSSLSSFDQVNGGPSVVVDALMNVDESIIKNWPIHWK